MQMTSGPAEYRGNLITRGGSHGLQARGGGSVRDNLFVENPLAFFIAGNRSEAVRNVVLNSNDIGPGGDARGYGIEVMQTPYAMVRENIVSGKLGTNPGGTALQVGWNLEWGPYFDIPDFQVAFDKNIVWRWPNDRAVQIPVYTDAARVVQDTNNVFDAASNGTQPMPRFVDPGRDVSDYMQQFGGGGLNALVERAASRPRGVWTPRWSAVQVNQFIRNGYDTPLYD